MNFCSQIKDEDVLLIKTSTLASFTKYGTLLPRHQKLLFILSQNYCGQMKRKEHGN